MITEAGGEALVYPVFNIQLQDQSAKMASAFDTLANMELVVFVSLHAARSAVQYCFRHDTTIPDNVKVAAIGPATADYLMMNRVKVAIQPNTSIDSEGLIEVLEEVNFRPRRTQIFRGQSGRELLYDTLTGWGGQVLQTESYRRVNNDDAFEPVFDQLIDADQSIVVATSVAILDGLMGKVKGERKERLNFLPVVAISQRVAKTCRNRGFLGPVTVAESPDNPALFAAMLKDFTGI